MTTSAPVPPALTAPCPCGSGKSFGDCCAPLLAQQRPAATAEELMRSRFTAHALHDFAHLHRTFLGTAGRPFAHELNEGTLAWTRLVVHAHELGPKPGTAFVDFTAYFVEEGVEQPLHEKSEFVQTDGTWLYARAVRQGPAPVKSAARKVGRNDPCPCGSGKKFKHCCGAAA